MHYTAQHEKETLSILSSYQVLEFSLKLYIATAYKFIKHKIDGGIPFNYNFKYIENFPLGKLLNLFSQLNGNIELHKRLSKLIKTRNEVAHQALLYHHDVFRDILSVDISSHVLNISNTATELDECLELLTHEITAMLDKTTPAI
jgi:hypothetical protein